MRMGLGLFLGGGTRSSGGGNGGDEYEMQAWRFTTGQALIGDLTGTDSPLFLSSVFLRSRIDISQSQNPPLLLPVWQTWNGPLICVSSEAKPGHLYVATNDADYTAFVQWRSVAPVITDLNKHHILVGVDTTAVDHADWTVVAYVDDVLVPMMVDDILPEIFPDGVIGGTGPCNASIYGEENPMHIPDFINLSYDADYGNLVLYTGQSGISGGAIPEVTRRLFSDASSNPVEPSMTIS
jgi:hypothetical protein